MAARAIKIEIGKTEAGAPLAFDLDVLLRTNLLLQANSGGGKSWAIRRLAEQLWGKVPVIIIDPEGEFSTLREIADYVLVGKGGDTPADVRSAGLVAHKLLELRCSAVCDLFEMPIRDRHAWIAAFLTAMVDAPKKLWGPVVVVVDEAHMFAPERSHGESVASEPMSALATRGRKRGYCAVMATQRLGKFSKDVAGECKNVMIGATFLDIDQERAAQALGVARADFKAFSLQLKLMQPGTFYALGRAVALERTLVRVGTVRSTHPEPGETRSMEPPPPSATIRKLLPQLADLPKEAERKQATEADLRRQVAELRAELERRPKPAVEVKTVTTEVVPAELEQERGAVMDAVNAARDALKTAERALISMHRLTTAKPRMVTLEPSSPGVLMKTVKVMHQQGAFVSPPARAASDGDGTLPKPQRIILQAMAQHPAGVTREQLSVLTGYARSTRDRQLQYLQAAGLVAQGERGSIGVTQAGMDALGDDYERLPTGDALRHHWLSKLPKPQSAILEVVSNAYPAPVSRDDISAATGYARSTRDRQIQYLQARKLVTSDRDGVQASPELFD